MKIHLTPEEFRNLDTHPDLKYSSNRGDLIRVLGQMFPIQPEMLFRLMSEELDLKIELEIKARFTDENLS